MSKVPVVLTNANQSFTDTQKAQGRTNIGAASTSDLNTEITNRTNADTTLLYDINNEAAARTNADTTLQNNINNEASERTNADTTLLYDINNEASERTNADTTINNRISTLGPHQMRSLAERISRQIHSLHSLGLLSICT